MLSKKGMPFIKILYHIRDKIGGSVYLCLLPLITSRLPRQPGKLIVFQVKSFYPEQQLSRWIERVKAALALASSTSSR